MGPSGSANAADQVRPTHPLVRSDRIRPLSVPNGMSHPVRSVVVAGFGAVEAGPWP